MLCTRVRTCELSLVRKLGYASGYAPNSFGGHSRDPPASRWYPGRRRTANRRSSTPLRLHRGVLVQTSGPHFLPLGNSRALAPHRPHRRGEAVPALLSPAVLGPLAASGQPELDGCRNRASLREAMKRCGHSSPRRSSSRWAPGPMWRGTCPVQVAAWLARTQNYSHSARLRRSARASESITAADGRARPCSRRLV